MTPSPSSKRNDSSPSASTPTTASWRVPLAHALLRPNEDEVAYDEALPLSRWMSDRLPTLFASPSDLAMVAAAIEAFRSHDTPPERPDPFTTIWPSLTAAVVSWKTTETTETTETVTQGIQSDLLVRLTSSADPKNPWLVRFASALRPSAPEIADALAFRWACVAAADARVALKKGWTTPEELDADLRSVLRITQWLATTVEDGGTEWIVRGLRGTPPLPGIVPAFRGEPWGQYYHFVSHDLPTPSHRRGDESVDRHVMTVRVPKDEVVLADDARLMPLVLASLTTLDAAAGWAPDARVTQQPPAVVVDAPLEAGAWTGNVFILRDTPAMIQIQKGPYLTADQ